MSLPKLYELAAERYSPKDKDSFAYTTVVKRWPSILTNIVSTISGANHTAEGEKLAEGKAIITKLSGLKHAMGRNAVLEPIPDDGGANLACYNDALAATPDEEKRWFTMNWLFAECYLYRLLRSYFALTTHWKEYDPFFESKAETYRSSSGAICHLASALNAMVDNKTLRDGFQMEGSPLEIAFWEIIQADLWGNATDLSLLVDLKYEDLQKLQAVGVAAQKEQSAKILRDDLPRVWRLLQGVEGGRIDIVLDNAGFELFTDFLLADFLVSCTPFVDTVVFHPKTIPWFVSDVLPFDFTWAIESLLDPDFFAGRATLTESQVTDLSNLAKRWQGHLDAGRFRLSTSTTLKLGASSSANFWTTQYAYQDLPTVDPTLLADLQKADLVIFKGDLNYRKLIGDAKWDPTTAFETALGERLCDKLTPGPLAGKFNLLSLRTNKADTICGLEVGVAERLDVEAKDWRVSGQYAVVSFCAVNK